MCVSQLNPSWAREDGRDLDRNAWCVLPKDEVQRAWACPTDAAAGAEAEGRGETYGNGATTRRRQRRAGGARERTSPWDGARFGRCKRSIAFVPGRGFSRLGFRRKLLLARKHHTISTRAGLLPRGWTGFHVPLSAKKVVQPLDLGDHVSVLFGLLFLPRDSPCIAFCEPEAER